MEFEFTSDQETLREAVARLFQSTYGSVTQRNEVADSDQGWSSEVWQSMAEMGILGLPFTEADGGSGAGVTEVAAVLGEAGRYLVPEPLIDCVYLPGTLVSDLGDAATKSRLISGLSDGSLLLALAHEEEGSQWPNITVATSITGGKITGAKFPVVGGDAADEFIVSALDESGVLGLYLVAGDAAGLTRTNYETHDERRGAQLRFDSVEATALGTADQAGPALERAYVLAQSLQTVETVGSLRAALQTTVDYLKQRKQFGVTLSTFQTLTHRAADMYVDIEMSDSLARAAIAAVSDGQFDSHRVSQAQLQIGRTAKFVGEQAVQMHGGIGITWEAPISHYLSRFVAQTHTFGSTDAHLRQLAAAVPGSVQV